MVIEIIGLPNGLSYGEYLRLATGGIPRMDEVLMQEGGLFVRPLDTDPDMDQLSHKELRFDDGSRAYFDPLTGDFIKW